MSANGRNRKVIIRIREEEINNLPVMAKLFFLLRKSKKLSIAGLRFIFQAFSKGKRTSQNG